MFFFFNDTATTEIYTLSLHDALPISQADDEKANARPSTVPGCLALPICSSPNLKQVQRKASPPERLRAPDCARSGHRGRFGGARGLRHLPFVPVDRKSVGVGKECRSRWSPYH